MYAAKSVASPTVGVKHYAAKAFAVQPNKGVLKKDSSSHESEPYVVDVVLDRIAITYSPTPDEVYEIEHNLSEMLWFGRKDGYALSRSIPVGTKLMENDGDMTGDTRVLVQCRPTKNKNIPYMRVTWNPSRIQATYVHFVLETVSLGLYGRLLTMGKVSQFHVAVDVVNAHIADYVFLRPGVRNHRTESKSGCSRYFGGCDSAQQLVVYDKATEMRKKNKCKPKHLKDLLPEVPITRIEERLNPHLHLQEVPKMLNYFSKLSVVRCNHRLHGDYVWRFYVDFVRHHGIDAALKVIDDPVVRAEFAARLQAGAVDWWDAEEVWSRVPGRIDELFAVIT